MALIDSVECVNDEVLTMSPTKFSTFTEMKIDHSGKLAAILFSGEVLCFGPLPSVSIIKQCIDPAIAAHYY